MTVEYNPVTGLGIAITEEIVEKLLFCGIFTEDEWNNADECLDKIGILYAQAGNALIGDERFYWIIPGTKLNDIIINTSKFIEDLNKIGIIITTDDVILIEDIDIG